MESLPARSGNPGEAGRRSRDPGHFALWQLQIALGRLEPVLYLLVKPAPG
ncbi:MAG TPA: hypothetical protein VHM23_25840 [Actinomycetota bacterium]|nr:hypothetical protein [Actinomycetota bacterium]